MPADADDTRQPITGQPEASGQLMVWAENFAFANRERVQACLASIWACGADRELLDRLQERLIELFPQLDELDRAVQNLARFIAASRQPQTLLALFERDTAVLPALLQIFSASQTLSNRLISDPENFDLIRASDGGHSGDRDLIGNLLSRVAETDQVVRAAVIIRKFYRQKVARIAYGEFVRGTSPDKVGRQLAAAADAIVEAGLRFTIRRLAERRGMPTRPDGTTPQITIIGLGHLGGEEMGYSSPMKLVLLYDSIDNKNVWHRDFFQSVVTELVGLLRGDESRADGVDIDLREGPRFEVGVPICSVREAAQIYESSGRIWQRLGFVKARVVAGSQELGRDFLQRLEPWVYQQFRSRVDLAEIRALRRKIEKQTLQNGASIDVARSPGGRDHVELTIQFLQLLHGGSLPSVRCGNTYDAIAALENEGCLTSQESLLLSENYARLSRLQHQLMVMFEQSKSQLPADQRSQARLAWQLGIRTEDGSGGDLDRFRLLLAETFERNLRVINHLMRDASDESGAIPVETELLFDPEPDPAVVESTMSRHGLCDASRALDNLHALSHETVPFLSPHRCRHFLSSIAPALLEEVARTPNPDAALKSLVHVTDSLGAKATLWELMASSRPTMELMVRLCATAPYLTEILTNNPGMIDELIDSLSMDRLPSTERLDALSIELCRGAADLDQVLHSFKNGAHLTIGVRDILGKESLEATHQAIGDTAEACLRRVIDFELEALADQFGDPRDAQGNPAELIALALGKFGGREPNYHSDLDAFFLYSDEGETVRRIGGHRSTMTNRVFFNQLSQRVVARINHAGNRGRLYELDSRLRRADEEGEAAISVEAFLQRFQQDDAPLWQRLALTRARCVSGSRQRRRQVETAVIALITETKWDPAMADQIRSIRSRMQATAHEDNFKRGEGGTVDAEFVAQMLTLKYASLSPQVIRRGTTTTLAALADAGHLDEKHSLGLTSAYRTIRRIEANLRLMNTPTRHELPVDDPAAMKNLAYLMGESDPSMIVAQCQQARQSSRAIFNQVFDRASDSS